MGPLIDSEKQLIIQMKESGFTLKDIASTISRNTITVRRYLLSQGHSLTNPWFSPDEKESIIHLFESGVSCREIAKKINRSSSGVTHFLSSQGYDTSSPFAITEHEK